jgi:DNA-binding winged helix-turn-helix (wHTH) protein
VIEQAVVAAEGGKRVDLPPQIEQSDARVAAPCFVVAKNGAWFRTPEGERVALGERKNLARILEALAQSRGRAFAVVDLIAVGWPGEKVQAKSGANRVYVALATLRRLGLRDIISKQRDGYLIAADAPVEIR